MMIYRLARSKTKFSKYGIISYGQFIMVYPNTHCKGNGHSKGLHWVFSLPSLGTGPLKAHCIGSEKVRQSI